MILRVVGAIGLGAVAVVAVGVAWWQPAPELSASDAVAAAETALRDAGVDGTVATDPMRSSYSTPSRAAVEVWSVRATVRSERIELQLARDGGHPVNIDDRTPDGTAYVLSEREYEAVASHVDDPAADRRRRRNIALSIATVLVVVLAISHARHAAREET